MDGVAAVDDAVFGGLECRSWGATTVAVRGSAWHWDSGCTSWKAVLAGDVGRCCCCGLGDEFGLGERGVGAHCVWVVAFVGDGWILGGGSAIAPVSFCQPRSSINLRR